MSPKDVLASIQAGDVSGLPRATDDYEPVLKGKSVILIQNSQSITAAIGGHAVDCDLVSEVKLVQWKVRGSADQLSGKYRLANDVRMAVGGKVVMLKAGKEFYDHQIAVEDVRQAGGVVLPLGTR